ncbi:MAG: hypothetical protein Q8S19_07385, partial [Bacillota bacterium]|nr:hypothetical protein [Bacillota bacterium]
LSKPWTHLIKMPGLRGAPQVNVVCSAEEHKHGLVTPRRIRVKANINLSTAEISLTEPGKKIVWSHLPASIARSTSHLNFEHIIPVPEGKPPIRRILSSEFKATVERVTTLRDRLIIKGTANIVINYIDS